MKIGVLLPTSKLYPSLMVDFTSGLRTAFAEFNLQDDIEFVFESIHQGTDKNLIMNGINKLVLQHQTEVNVLFCNYLLLDDIASSINALQRPLIVTNIGGNSPCMFDPGEYILLNSFGLWESAYLAAKWATSKFGKRAAHGSYFYEAGYGLYASFFQGFKSFEGEIVLNQISEFNPNPDDFDNFMNRATIENPDFLYMLYSERDAVNFLTKLVNSDKNGKYPIVSSGVLINDEILEKVEGIPQQIFNVASWDISDITEENKHFSEEYNKHVEIKPNYFSLLGYECAGMLCSAINQQEWSGNGKEQLLTLKSIEFLSPRGKLSFGNPMNSTAVEHHVYELDSNGKRKRIQSLGLLNSRLEILNDSKQNNNPQGWYQPYLCQ